MPFADNLQANGQTILRKTAADTGRRLSSLIIESSVSNMCNGVISIRSECLCWKPDSRHHRRYNIIIVFETLSDDDPEQWHHVDCLFGNVFRVALGLLLNIPFNEFGREGNMGSAGAGGYTVFADPNDKNLLF
jgi:hypothetical protein